MHCDLRNRIQYLRRLANIRTGATNRLYETETLR